MVGIASLYAAISYRNTLDSACTLDLLEYARNVLSTIPYLSFVGTKKDNIGIISFVIDGISIQTIQDHLERHNICIRTGGHCAHPLLEYL